MNTISIPVFGGLGNQMFQVAHALELCRLNGAEPSFIDLASVTGRVARKWELDCFGISRTELSGLLGTLLKARIVASRQLLKLSPALHLGVLDDTVEPVADKTRGRPIKVCTGYWQGEKYFKGSTDLVRRTLTFPEISKLPADMNFSTDQPSVAVHVRRGDYVSDPIANAYHFVCDANWYRIAINQMRERIPGAAFFMFSDDQRWAQDIFGNEKDVSIVRTDDAAPAWNDMALMSRCQHFIISNSSYSWWSSYLGKSKNSLIVAPKFWFRGISTRENALFCSDWTLL